MFRVPSAHWSDTERHKWSVDVAVKLRWNQFTFPAFISNVAGNLDVNVTAAIDDVRLQGLRVGMPVTVSPDPTLDAAMAVGGAWVAANDSLTVRLVNVTGAVVNQPSSTWSYFGVIL